MYGKYLEEMRKLRGGRLAVYESFLQWHRGRRYDTETNDVACVTGKGGKSLVCACRYWYELNDGYWGQLGLTQIPHEPNYLLPSDGVKHVGHLEHFVGLVEYMLSWKWHAQAEVVCPHGFVFELRALPLRVDDKCKKVELSEEHVE